MARMNRHETKDVMAGWLMVLIFVLLSFTAMVITALVAGTH